MDIINTWQFSIIGFWISIVAFYQLYKLAVQQAKSDGAATVLLQLIGGGSVLLLSPFFAWKFPTDWRVYGLLTFAAIFYALSDRLQTTARKHLPVSSFAIINQLQSVFMVIIGLVIFQEPLIVNKLIGAGLILSSNALLLYQKGAFKLTPHTLVAIAASFTFAIAISIDIGISGQFNLPVYIAFTLLVPAIMIWIMDRVSWHQILEEWRSEQQEYYLWTGLIWGIMIIFALRSYQFGSVTTIVPLAALAVPLNVLVAYFVQAERSQPLRKLVAAGLIVVGMYLTVI